MFPKPTAYPTQDNKKSNRPVQFPRSLFSSLETLELSSLVDDSSPTFFVWKGKKKKVLRKIILCSNFNKVKINLNTKFKKMLLILFQKQIEHLNVYAIVLF